MLPYMRNLSFEFCEVYRDNNIFMNKKISYFLNSLSSKNKIIIPKEQYNELTRLKHSNNKEKAYKARNAFKRIENLYDRGIAKIENLTNMHKDGFYADPIFIDMILQDIKNNIKVAFITEDRDLRLRLKFELDKNDSYRDYIVIYTLNDIMEQKATRRIKTDMITKIFKVIFP